MQDRLVYPVDNLHSSCPGLDSGLAEDNLVDSSRPAAAVRNSLAAAAGNSLQEEDPVVGSSPCWDSTGSNHCCRMAAAVAAAGRKMVVRAAGRRLVGAAGRCRRPGADRTVSTLYRNLAVAGKWTCRYRKPADMCSGQSISFPSGRLLGANG